MCFGLKGHSMSAQGNALGSRFNETKSPERASQMLWMYPKSIVWIRRIIVLPLQGKGYQLGSIPGAAFIRIRGFTCPRLTCCAPLGRNAILLARKAIAICVPA